MGEPDSFHTSLDKALGGTEGQTPEPTIALPLLWEGDQA